MRRRWWGALSLAFVCACASEAPIGSATAGDTGGEVTAAREAHALEVDPWGGEPGVTDLTATATGGVAIHRVVETYADEGDETFLVRHELDSAGRPRGPATRVADMPPMVMTLRTALVGESTLVVVVSDGEDGGYAFSGLWLNADGAARGDRFPIASTPDEETDLLVAPAGESRARVIVSAPAIECALDGEVDTQECPSWAHYWVPTDGAPSEAEPPDGTPDGANVMLAGSTRGSVYVATGATFGGGISVGIEVEGVDGGAALDGFGVPEVEGFLIAEERVAVLAADYDAERDRVAIYGPDGAEFEEDMPNGVIDVPLGSSELACDGDVPVGRARMQGLDGEVAVEVRAGDRAGTAPWHLWMSDTSVPQLRSASTTGAVFTLAPETEPGELLRTRCVDGERVDDRIRWLRPE